MLRERSEPQNTLLVLPKPQSEDTAAQMHNQQMDDQEERPVVRVGISREFVFRVETQLENAPPQSVQVLLKREVVERHQAETGRECELVEGDQIEEEAQPAKIGSEYGTTPDEPATAQLRI